MSDLIIDSCHWHVDAEAPPYKQRAQDHFRDRYIVLIDFLRENDLLIDSTFGQKIDDWPSFEIRQSHLTEEGLKLFKLCIGTWSPAFGQANTKRHLVQWKRKLAELRSSV